MYQEGDKQMRLIDADKIRYRDMSGGSVPNGVWYTFLDDVEKIPTVKAIPFEWIKNYASHKASKDLIDCYWHFWEDDVLKMVAEWEKENARD
jgi:hypothetical protein